MSIFSSPSSSTIFLTLEPLGPTQAPIGSIFSSIDLTAILVLEPASLDTDFIWTIPSNISGTSNSNKQNKTKSKEGWPLQKTKKVPQRKCIACQERDSKKGLIRIDTDFIWTIPSNISGTSNSNNLLTNPGWLLDTTIWGPLLVFFTSNIYTFIFCPAW